MKELERLALAAAARGLVSGKLEEWPVLGAALRAQGHPLPSDAGLRAMREAAQAALGEDAPVGKGSCCEHCAQVIEMKSSVDVTKAIVQRIEESMVYRGEFKPVRAIAYGFVGLMATAFVGALATLAAAALK